MDIAALSSNLAQAQTRDTAQLFVMKKAMDLQSAGALQLIASVAPMTPSANLPPHLGQNINTTA